jgi:hypothetical protein
MLSRVYFSEGGEYGKLYAARCSGRVFMANSTDGLFSRVE